MSSERTTSRWVSAWPDALAFALGLSVARIAGWTTTDLVWSLWLSSLVVGYASIVWMILRPAISIASGATRERPFMAQVLRESPGPVIGGTSIVVVGGLFLLAFFTVHFGGFHYVHSQFLSSFFPLDGGVAGRGGWAGTSVYAEVVRRYWLFLPSAFLAERAAFLKTPALEDLLPTKGAKSGMFAGMFAPYRNVMRMHGLIFFFGFAHFAGSDSFAVFAVVYAVYFFPWRLVRRY
jgi:hypothetical protein